MYDIKYVANDLLLEPTDLQDIYCDFFQEAAVLLGGCEEKMTALDFNGMRQDIHAVTGMAANLRMVQLVQLTRQTEQELMQQNGASLRSLLGAIRREIEALREQVNRFYAIG